MKLSIPLVPILAFLAWLTPAPATAQSQPTILYPNAIRVAYAGGLACRPTFTQAVINGPSGAMTLSVLTNANGPVLITLTGEVMNPDGWPMDMLYLGQATLTGSGVVQLSGQPFWFAPPAIQVFVRGCALAGR